MVNIRYAVAGLIVALVMAMIPNPAHAQQNQENIIALLEQIAKLAQIVIQLQTQLIELQTTTLPQVQGETLKLPVYVHLFNSPYESVQAHTTEEGIRQIFSDTKSGVNKHFWEQADIAWVLKGVQTHYIENGTDREYNSARLLDDDEAARDHFLRFPEGIVLSQGFHVFVVHSFSTLENNGFYFSTSGIAFVSETNGRQSGINYMAYLFAHELGHALGLRHEGNFYNLMHTGKKGNTVPRRNRNNLTLAQIAEARTQAKLGAPYIR